MAVSQPRYAAAAPCTHRSAPCVPRSCSGAYCDKLGGVATLRIHGCERSRAQTAALLQLRRRPYLHSNHLCRPELAITCAADWFVLGYYTARAIALVIGVSPCCRDICFRYVRRAIRAVFKACIGCARNWRLMHWREVAKDLHVNVGGYFAGQYSARISARIFLK